MAFAARHYNLISGTSIYQEYVVSGMFTGANFTTRSPNSEGLIKDRLALVGSIQLAVEYTSGGMPQIKLVECFTSGNIYKATISGITGSPICTVTPRYYPDINDLQNYESGTSAERIRILPVATATQPTIQINPNTPEFNSESFDDNSSAPRHIRYRASGRHSRTDAPRPERPTSAVSIIRSFLIDSVYSGIYHSHPDNIGFEIKLLSNSTWKINMRDFHEFDTTAMVATHIVILTHNNTRYLFSRDFFSL